MKEKLSREAIAMRVAREFFDGATVNLGIGIPTLCASFIPEGINVTFHTENGALGFGPVITQDLFSSWADIDLVNAGGQYVLPKPGMAFLNHAESFAMVRSGRVDISVLGVIEISEKGDLANWMFPTRGIGNIGGGMDLAFNCKTVICATEHVTKQGQPKIVKHCRIPLTAPSCVHMVITDISVIKFTPGGPVLTELAPGWTPEEVQQLTEPTLTISEEVKEMTL